MLSENTKKELEDLFDYFDSCNGGYYEDKKYYEVNVKRYDDYVDTDKIINSYPVKYRKRIIERFDDDYIYNHHNIWLEYEANYWIDEYIKNGCACDKDCDCAVCKIREYLDTDNIYLLGRNSGHFCFSVNDNRDDIENILTDNDDSCQAYTNGEIELVIQEAKKIQSLIIDFKEWVTKTNKEMKFEDELKYRIEEYIDELKSDDAEKMKTTKRVNKNKEDKNITSKTLADYLIDDNEIIKRHATGILKEINK